MGISVFIADFIANTINKKDITQKVKGCVARLDDDEKEKRSLNLEIVRI